MCICACVRVCMCPCMCLWTGRVCASVCLCPSSRACDVDVTITSGQLPFSLNPLPRHVDADDGTECGVVATEVHAIVSHHEPCYITRVYTRYTSLKPDVPTWFSLHCWRHARARPESHDFRAARSAWWGRCLVGRRRRRQKATRTAGPRLWRSTSTCTHDCVEAATCSQSSNSRAGAQHTCAVAQHKIYEHCSRCSGEVPSLHD